MFHVWAASAAGQGIGLPVVVPTLGWVALAAAISIAVLAPGLRHVRGTVVPRRIEKIEPAANAAAG